MTRPGRRWAAALACSLAINSVALAAFIYGASPAPAREPIYMEVSLAELFAPAVEAPSPENAPPAAVRPTGPGRELAASDNTAPASPLVATNAGPGAYAPAAALPAGGSGGNQPRSSSPAGPSGRGPRVLYSPEPIYPENARKNGWQGTVRLRVLVGVKGQVEDVVMGVGSGYPELDRAAADAVRKWRFAPAVQEGKAAVAWITLPVVFVLK